MISKSFHREGRWTAWMTHADGSTTTLPVWSYNDALFWARRLSGLLIITEQAWLEMTALGQTPPVLPAHVTLF